MDEHAETASTRTDGELQESVPQVDSDPVEEQADGPAEKQAEPKQEMRPRSIESEDAAPPTTTRAHVFPDEGTDDTSCLVPAVDAPPNAFNGGVEALTVPESMVPSIQTTHLNNPGAVSSLGSAPDWPIRDSEVQAMLSKVKRRACARFGIGRLASEQSTSSSAGQSFNKTDQILDKYKRMKKEEERIANNARVLDTFSALLKAFRHNQLSHFELCELQRQLPPLQTQQGKGGTEWSNRVRQVEQRLQVAVESRPVQRTGAQPTEEELFLIEGLELQLASQKRRWARGYDVHSLPPWARRGSSYLNPTSFASLVPLGDSGGDAERLLAATSLPGKSAESCVSTIVGGKVKDGVGGKRNASSKGQGKKDLFAHRSDLFGVFLCGKQGVPSKITILVRDGTQVCQRGARVRLRSDLYALIDTTSPKTFDARVAAVVRRLDGLRRLLAHPPAALRARYKRTWGAEGCGGGHVLPTVGVKGMLVRQERPGVWHVHFASSPVTYPIPVGENGLFLLELAEGAH